MCVLHLAKTIKMKICVHLKFLDIFVKLCQMKGIYHLENSMSNQAYNFTQKNYLFTIFQNLLINFSKGRIHHLIGDNIFCVFCVSRSAIRNQTEGITKFLL